MKTISVTNKKLKKIVQSYEELYDHSPLIILLGIPSGYEVKIRISPLPFAESVDRIMSLVGQACDCNVEGFYKKIIVCSRFHKGDKLVVSASNSISAVYTGEVVDWERVYYETL